jgi:hypothetical protein
MIKSRRMKWAGHIACMGERRGTYRVLVGKTEGKRPLGIHRRDGRIILKWIFSKCDGGMGWINLAQDWDRWQALANAAVNLGVP